MQILIQKVRDEAPKYCISYHSLGDVGIADPRPPLRVAMVADAVSQVWEFLADPTSLVTFLLLVFALILLSILKVGFSMLPRAEWKVWWFSCMFLLFCWYSIAMASLLFWSVLLLCYISLLIYLSASCFQIMAVLLSHPVMTFSFFCSLWFLTFSSDAVDDSLPQLFAYCFQHFSVKGAVK